MNTRTPDGNVVYMKPEFQRAANRHALTASAWGTGQRVGRGLLAALTFTFWGLWEVARVAISALLALAEPFLRLILCGGAFLGFVVTIIFGFMLDAPHFPKWGMLGLSVGALVLYWLYLALMGLFMRLPPACHDAHY